MPRRQFFSVLVLIREVEGLGMRVGDGAASLPHSVLLRAVVGPVLLAGLLIVVTTGGIIPVSGHKLVPWGRHGRQGGGRGGAAIVVSIFGGATVLGGAYGTTVGVGVIFPFHTILDTLEEHVEKLNDVQSKRHQGHNQHEEDEDGFLSWTGQETVHSVRAWISLTGVDGIQAKPINVPLNQQESHLEDRFKQDADDVSTEQSPTHLHLAMLFDPILEFLNFYLLEVHIHIHTIILDHLELFFSFVQLLFFPHYIEHMCQVQKGRYRHKYDLQNPEAYMGDGERLVIADILTTRLLSVAPESRLFISPSRFNCCPQEQDSENKEDRQPHFPSCSRIGLNLIKKFSQGTPITHLHRMLAKGHKEKKK